MAPSKPRKAAYGTSYPVKIILKPTSANPPVSYYSSGSQQQAGKIFYASSTTTSRNSRAIQNKNVISSSECVAVKNGLYYFQKKTISALFCLDLAKRTSYRPAENKSDSSGSSTGKTRSGSTPEKSAQIAFIPSFSSSNLSPDEGKFLKSHFLTDKGVNSSKFRRLPKEMSARPAVAESSSGDVSAASVFPPPSSAVGNSENSVPLWIKIGNMIATADLAEPQALCK